MVVHLPEDLAKQSLIEEQQVLERLRAGASRPLTDQLGQVIFSSLRANVAEQTGLQESDVQISAPPGHVDESFDYALPMFPAAKTLRKSPTVISQELAPSFTDNEHIASSVATGPYINVGLDRTSVYDALLRNGLSYPADDLVRGTNNEGEVYVVDYSSPNIAKRLGLQHVPTTIVGESLSRIYEANGAQIVRANHIGDYGTPFGKVLAGWKLYGDPDAYRQDPVGHMHELYVRVNREAKASPELAARAKAEFAALEQGDPENVAIWQMMRGASLEENQTLYDRLGITFDTTLGESYFAASGQQIVDEMIAAGIAVVNSDNSVFIPAAENVAPLVLRKSDGSTLYGTRDLAALRYRMQTYSPDGIRYVVGAEQNDHFLSVFEAARRANILPDGNVAEHVQLGLLANKDGKKMSSRGGEITTFTSVLDRSTAAAREMLLHRYVDTPERLTQVEELSEQLGIGAVAYTVLRKDPSTNTTIANDAGAHKEAGTAGYLQYTHARATTALARSGQDFIPNVPQYIFTEPEEWAVAKAVMDLPVAVMRAAQEDAPHHVAQALETVANSFNTMYQNPNARILTSDTALRASRTALTHLVQIALKKGLNLLVIEAPNQV